MTGPWDDGEAKFAAGAGWHPTRVQILWNVFMRAGFDLGTQQGQDAATEFVRIGIESQRRRARSRARRAVVWAGIGGAIFAAFLATGVPAAWAWVASWLKP